MTLDGLKSTLDDLFDNDSEFFVVRGPKRSGKTNFIFLLMEGAHEFGYFKRFAGNVEIENAPFDYQVIKDLQTLKFYARTVGRLLFFFDEMGKNIPRATPWAKLNIETLRALEVIRKYKLTLAGAFIGNSVSDRILSEDYLDAYIEKTGLTTAVITDYRHHRTVRLVDIPCSSIRYAEYQDVDFYDKPPPSTANLKLFSTDEIALCEKIRSKAPVTGAERKAYQRLREKWFWKVFDGELTPTGHLGGEGLTGKESPEGRRLI